MSFYLSLPFAFLWFWFVEAPLGLIRFFTSLNSACIHLLSLPLFLRTFFRPLKNEYREGLVGFSIGLGIVIKTVFIVVDLLLLGILLLVEFMVLSLFLLWPVLTILLTVV